MLYMCAYEYLPSRYTITVAKISRKSPSRKPFFIINRMRAQTISFTIKRHACISDAIFISIFFALSLPPFHSVATS